MPLAYLAFEQACLAKLQQVKAGKVPDCVCKALDYLGAVIIDEGDSMGAGGRMSFSCTTVRQLTQLERDWQ